MLNINGSGEESVVTSNGQTGLQDIYDYYKLPVVVEANKGITLITADGKTVSAEAASLNDMVWR